MPPNKEILEERELRVGLKQKAKDFKQSGAEVWANGMNSFSIAVETESDIESSDRFVSGRRRPFPAI